MATQKALLKKKNEVIERFKKQQSVVFRKIINAEELESRKKLCMNLSEITTEFLIETHDIDKKLMTSRNTYAIGHKSSII